MPKAQVRAIVLACKSASVTIKVMGSSGDTLRPNEM
jgi:hypothetical protein